MQCGYKDCFTGAVTRGPVGGTDSAACAPGDRLVEFFRGPRVVFAPFSVIAVISTVTPNPSTERPTPTKSPIYAGLACMMHSKGTVNAESAIKIRGSTMVVLGQNGAVSTSSDRAPDPLREQIQVRTPRVGGDTRSLPQLLQRSKFRLCRVEAL